MMMSNWAQKITVLVNQFWNEAMIELSAGERLGMTMVHGMNEWSWWKKQSSYVGRGNIL